MFIINKHGHYFEINKNVNADPVAFNDCRFFDTEEEMLKEICRQQGLEME